MQRAPSVSAYPLMFQSAPAPRGGRCQPIGYVAGLDTGFQSAPAPRGGRCPKKPISRWVTASFNPRPPRGAGDARALAAYNWGIGFQSAPAPRGGRCTQRWSYTAPASSFNPRPPRGAGDAGIAPPPLRHQRVSIRARPEGRAMPPRGSASSVAVLVSIRARPEGRAMLSFPPVVAPSGQVSIRARPEGRAMRVCAAAALASQ